MCQIIVGRCAVRQTPEWLLLKMGPSFPADLGDLARKLGLLGSLPNRRRALSAGCSTRGSVLEELKELKSGRGEKTREEGGPYQHTTGSRQSLAQTLCLRVLVLACLLVHNVPASILKQHLYPGGRLSIKRKGAASWYLHSSVVTS